MHPPDAHLDSVQSAEAMKQLVELGYIEEVPDDASEAIRETVRELHYNLAQAHMDGGQFREAAELLEQIWNDWPHEHRFGLNYIACLGALERWDERGLAIERLGMNVNAASMWALEELEKIRPEAATYGVKLPKPRTVADAAESADVDPDAPLVEADGYGADPDAEKAG